MTLIDYAKRQAHIAIFGDQIISPRLDDISVQFQYNIATKDIVNGGVVTGSGSVAHDGTNAMRVRSGTGAAAGSAIATSADNVRYRTGHDIYVYFTCRFSDPAAGCSQLIGLMDASDGIGIGYNGKAFSTFLRSGGVTTFQAINSGGDIELAPDPDLAFAGISSFVMNPQAVNLFRINLGYLGIAPIFFEAFGGVKAGWVPFQVLEFTNRQPTSHLQNPVLPMRVEVLSDGSAIVDIHTISWNAGVTIDRQDEKADRYFVDENSKSGITTSTNILTLKNQSSWQSKTNHIVVELTYLSVSVDGPKNTTFRIRRNSTLGGAPSYTNIDATNSVVQRDVAGTTVSATEIAFSGQLGKADSRYFDLTDQHIRMQPGETLTISATSAQATDAFVSVGWREMF